MKRIRFTHCLFGIVVSIPIALAHDGPHKTAPADAFSAEALTQAPEQVSCVLESGTETTCLKLTVRHKPSDLEIGPFCPAQIDTEGGIWNWTGKAAGLYRVDEFFLRMIAEQGYQMFDENGTVHVSDIAKAEPTEEHSCIQVSEDDSVEITALIPLSPEMADRPKRLGIVNKVGMALNGTPIFSDAPSVHHTGHMPALDTCGGHVDPGGWYHWHANATDIESVFEATNIDASCHLTQIPAGLFGYAFDGYPIYGSLEASGAVPEDLDECGGHIGTMPDGTSGYHYHTSDAFPNLPKCLVGVPARTNFSTTAQAGIGAMPRAGTNVTRREPPGRRPDRARLERAADELGVSVEDLHQAIRQAGGRPPNFAAVAETLGVGEKELRSALPPPPGRRH